jgi:hypothetical protein
LRARARLCVSAAEGRSPSTPLRAGYTDVHPNYPAATPPCGAWYALHHPSPSPCTTCPGLAPLAHFRHWLPVTHLPAQFPLPTASSAGGRRHPSSRIITPVLRDLLRRAFFVGLIHVVQSMSCLRAGDAGNMRDKNGRGMCARNRNE